MAFPFQAAVPTENPIQRFPPMPNARLMRPYVHPLNVADFKGIRAG